MIPLDESEIKSSRTNSTWDRNRDRDRDRDLVWNDMTAYRLHADCIQTAYRTTKYVHGTTEYSKYNEQQREHAVQLQYHCRVSGLHMTAARDSCT